MRTLIVSNRLTVDPEVLETEIVSWDDRPSVEGFPLVVLDLHFGESSADGFVKIDTPSHRFYELGAEVSRCLKAGGVVISCLGPIANTNRDLGGDGYRENAVSRKRARLESEQLPDARFESSYDWLDQGLLQKLQLGHRYVRPSEGLQWLLPNERFSRIKATLQKYVESFSNLDNYSGRASITYTMDESRRWDSNQHVIQTDVRILATAYHTNISVAMSFDYN